VPAKKQPDEKGKNLLISKELRKIFGLNELLGSQITEAEKTYKTGYYGLRIPTKPAKIAKDLISVDEQIKKLIAKRDDLREKLITVFVKENIKVIDNVQMIPKSSITLNEALALGMLKKGMQKKVLVKKLIFDLETFLKLVEKQEIPLQVLLASAVAEYNVQVSPKKSKRKK